jgi:hypothetical protein
MKKANAILGALLALGVLLGTPPALAQEDGAVPGGVTGNKSASDKWREFRSGAPGYVSNPEMEPRLIREGFYECAKSGNCSEWAAGFAMPIHSKMPIIFEPQGRGANGAVILFLLAVAGVLFGWWGYVWLKAGSNSPSDHHAAE